MLQRAGEIRYFGSSTFSGWQLEEARLGRRAQWAVPLPDRAAAVLDLRAADRARRAPVARNATGWVCLVWSPLGRGWLTGRYRREAFDRSPEARGREGRRSRDGAGSSTSQARRYSAKLDLVEELAKLAADGGRSDDAPGDRAFALAHPAC